MSWLSRIVNVFRGGAGDRQLDEELQFHVDSRARDLMADGLAPDEAYRGSPAAAWERRRDSQRSRK